MGQQAIEFDLLDRSLMFKPGCGLLTREPQCHLIGFASHFFARLSDGRVIVLSAIHLGQRECFIRISSRLMVPLMQLKFIGFGACCKALDALYP